MKVEGKKREKNEGKLKWSMREMWDTIKCANTGLLKIPEGNLPL